MATNAERLRAAFGSRDLEQLVALLDERVVWRGLPDVDYGAAGQTGTVVDDHDRWPEDGGDGDSRPDHDHDYLPLCTNRDEVRAILEGFVAAGNTGLPAIVARAGDSIVVDPRVEPALPFPLHQTFTFRGGRVVLIQDYADRAAALADLSS
jgi:ketosteroid isomerase-like protein